MISLFTYVATATGASPATQVDATLHTVQTVGVGTGTIRLEGSLDGTNYFDLSGAQALGTMFSVVNRTVNWVRLNVLTLAGGGTTATYTGGAQC